MNQGKTVLSQLIFLPKYEFDKCVKRYQGNYKVRSFTCWEQFLVKSLRNLTYRESLRGIEACLGAVQSKLYHSGVNSKVSRPTLSKAHFKIGLASNYRTEVCDLTFSMNEGSLAELIKQIKKYLSIINKRT